MKENSKPYNWGPVIFLIVFHLALITLLPYYLYYHTFSISLFVTAFVLLYATGMSITGGYHRHYSHRSYRTNQFVEFVLLFLGSMTAQGSALRWAFDHRLHHANVDTDDDPYTITKGFWYAHCLWIQEKPRVIDPKVVADLLKNKLVVFQHTYYKPCMIVTNVLTILFFGWLFNDYLGAFVVIFLLRLIVLLHFTWFINSLAHTWGEKPFSQELTAVDNYFLSMLTFGEGYHNYHHTFANDYRNGIHWFHFDPTKWMIWTLSKLGLATGLKRMDAATIQKRIVIESKNLLLNQIKEACCSKKDELEKVIHETSDRIVAKIAQFNELKEQYMQSKQAKACKSLVKELKGELNELKKSIQHDWNEWMTISKDVKRLTMQPA